MIDYLNLSRKTNEGRVGIGQYPLSSGPADKNTSAGQYHMKGFHRLRTAGPAPAGGDLDDEIPF